MPYAAPVPGSDAASARDEHRLVARGSSTFDVDDAVPDLPAAGKTRTSSGDEQGFAVQARIPRAAAVRRIRTRAFAIRVYRLHINLHPAPVRALPVAWS